MNHNTNSYQSKNPAVRYKADVRHGGKPPKKDSGMYRYLLVAAVCVLLLFLLVLGVILIGKTIYESKLPPDDTDMTSDETPGPAETTGGPEEQTTPPDTTAPDTSAPPETTEEPYVPPTPVTGIPGLDDTEDYETRAPETPRVDGRYPYEPLLSPELRFPDTLLRESADAGQSYLDRIVFLGDSLTYGLRFYAMLNGGKNTTQVWTPSNGTMTLNKVADIKIWYPEEQREITVREALRKKQPEILVITLGVNGIAWLGEQPFKNEFRTLIEAVRENSPQTKVVLQSIFPIAASYQMQGSINNSKISRANEWIIEVAAEMGITYLNTANALVDPDGFLPESYQSGDGMHMNSSSYNVILNYIRTHALNGYS